MAASESLRFDIIGNDRASDAFSKVGRSATDMGGKMDMAARLALALDEALKRQRASVRSNYAATLELAKADDSLSEAERQLARDALAADAALRREADAKKKSGDAARKAAADNAGFAASLQKVAGNAQKGGGPAWLGPALALAPAAATLAGVGAGAAIGIGGAAVAGAGALAAFGAVAKPVLAQALTAEQAVQKAQDAYNIAIANGTKQAVAYKTEQIAIAKAYAEMSPQQIALSKQLAAVGNAWQAVKAAETPVVAGALQPWLKSVTDLTGKLGPIISAVAPFIQYLGTQFDRLVNSAAFTKFRDFIAGTGSAVVGAVGNSAIDLVKAFIVLLPQFAPLIDKAAGAVLTFGQNILKWSQSKKASDDITKFMGWFTSNGPVVGRLLVNIGGALKALAPGLTTGGAAELNVMSQFFAFIAKLPPAFAKPLAEVAGAMLILNKIGVISVGVKIVGAAAKWLSAGLVELGGGAAAGAEINTAMTSGGAAAAAEIRAAMTTGGAAAGAEAGAAEATAMKLSAPAIGTTIGLAVTAQIAGYFAYRQFSNAFSAGVKGGSAAGQYGSSGQGASLGAVLSGTGTNTAAGLLKNTAPLDKLLTELGYTQYSINLINKAVVKPGSDVGKVDALIYSLGGTQSDILAINKLITKPKSDSSNIDGLQKKIALTPIQISAANKLILKPHSDTTPVSNLQKAIDSLHGKTVNVIMRAAGSGSIYFNETTGVGGSVSGGLKFMAAGGRVPGTGSGDTVPALLTPGEAVVPKHLVPAVAPFLRGKVPGFAAGGIVPNPSGLPGWMAGVEGPFGKGVENSFAVRLISNLKAAVRTAAAAQAGSAGGSGVTRWAPVILQALAMLGQSPANLGAVEHRMNQESGGNPRAINLWDINARNGDPSRGLMQVIMATFQRYRSFALPNDIYSPLANVYAGLHYAELAYPGRSLSSVMLQAGGYDQGGYLPPGLSLAYNGTGAPEPVGAARGGGGNVYITVNVPPTVNPASAGQQIANLLGAHIKRGGRLYPAGTTPR